MWIQIDNPALIDDLSSYLRECSCDVDGVRRTSLNASPPAAALDPELARLQLDGFLRAWAVRHPETTLSTTGARPKQSS